MPSLMTSASISRSRRTMSMSPGVPSFTFHGRDIFAPVAAHLSLGVPLEEFGEAIVVLRRRLHLADGRPDPVLVRCS